MKHFIFLALFLIPIVVQCDYNYYEVDRQTECNKEEK